MHIFSNSPAPKKRKDYRKESFTNFIVSKECKNYRIESTSNLPVPKERKDYRIESSINSPVLKKRKDYREHVVPYCLFPERTIIIEQANIKMIRSNIIQKEKIIRIKLERNIQQFILLLSFQSTNRFALANMY